MYPRTKKGHYFGDGSIPKLGQRCVAMSSWFAFKTNGGGGIVHGYCAAAILLPLPYRFSVSRLCRLVGSKKHTYKQIIVQFAKSDNTFVL